MSTMLADTNYRTHARTLSDALAAVQQREQANPVAAYVEQDALQQRQNDAVLHEAPALDGIRKGDLARVQTSNARVPFVGRVEKLTWDGRVCVKQGDVCYWTRRERVTVLSRVEG